MNNVGYVLQSLSTPTSTGFVPISTWTNSSCGGRTKLIKISKKPLYNIVKPTKSPSRLVRCQQEQTGTVKTSSNGIVTTNNDRIRPFHTRNFCLCFRDLLIREWRPRDRLHCAELIGSILQEYGLEWDPLSADRDVMQVEDAYENGEFWVVQEMSTGEIVGTGAYYEVPHRGKSVVEIRKMYLSKKVRGIGLGSFLLNSLEQRALQVGYNTVFVETASCLTEACELYKRCGYKPASGLETERCDIIMKKELYPVKIGTGGKIPLEIVDSTQGWSVMHASRKLVDNHSLLFRAVVVLVETGNQVVVHKRSMNKSSYPGRMAALVTGCVDWQESPLESAVREVEEELGLSNLQFSEAFEPFVMKERGETNLRIRFHPFVARGDFSAEDIVINEDEIENFQLMTRRSIHEQTIGGSLWDMFRSQGM